MEVFSSKIYAYSIFFGIPVIIGLLSMIINAFFLGKWEFFTMIPNFVQIFIVFMSISGIGAFFATVLYSKKAPILGLPPKGWGLQLNSFFCVIIGVSYIIGQILARLRNEFAFQEVFFMLGTILAYILAYVIYFSFSTLSGREYIFLALIQPVVGIILYSIWTAQIPVLFFINTNYLGFFLRAILFFCTCAFLFALPYGRKLFHVSTIYKDATGIGGYAFIRAFVLSMLMEGEDDLIEKYFDNVGVGSDVKVQYLSIRSEREQKLKGLFVIPQIHFGPFKTCGSSDLPENIYKALDFIPGTTVYHTTNTHTQNLTTQVEVDKVIEQIVSDVNSITNDKSIKWSKDVVDFTRKISNSAKLIGMVVDRVPVIFLTRHPLPSDDIQAEIGEDIRALAEAEGFNEAIILDSHNSIIGDEILIERNSIEARDLMNVAEKYLINNKPEEVEQAPLLYGVAKDPLKEYSEKDGIGYGGMVVHLFKNVTTNLNTVLVHFDGNNAFLDIRSFILNELQNKGIERGEVTTSDSHTVARQFTARGYSPIGDKIKFDYILKKLDILLHEAERDLEPVEFHYSDTTLEGIRIWGNAKYFDTIMDTLQECIKVSQRLLSLSLIIPGFFSLILLLFFYSLPPFT